MPSAARAELDAAGIIDPALRDGYAVCRALNAHHGRTYFLATRLLPAARRPAVHALYGFARYADEIVDDLADTSPAAEKAARLDELSARLQRALAGAPAEDLAPPAESPPHISTAQLPAERTGEPPEYAGYEGRLAGTPSRNLDPPIYATDFRRGALVLAAVTDTARRYALDPALFADFMASMRMDTMVTEYATFDDLGRYVHGSAAVIGLQMLPILGTTVPREEAEEPAAALGVAFQITNFLRDVGEDLDRGRVYLPTEELAAFGVDRELLTWCRRTRRPDARVRRALAHLVAHTRAIYRRAAPGVGMLEPVSRACVACAFTLYRGILDQIEAADYDVLHRRVSVPRRTRAAVAVPALVRALAARARP